MSAESSRRISITQLLAPHWKTLALGLNAAVFCSAMDLLQPWPLKIVIDHVLGSKPIPEWLTHLAPGVVSNRFLLLNATAISLIVIAVAGAVGTYVQNMLMTSAGQWVMHELRTTLYHHIQRLSLSYHENTQAGDLISRVTNDIDTIQNFVTSTLLDAILDFLMLVGMIAIMCSINVRFTLVALAIAPFLFALIYRYTHRIKRASRAVRKKESELLSNIQEVFTSIRVVKAFAQEKYERRRFADESLESVELTLRAKALKAGLSPLVDIIVAIGSAAVLWYGSRLVLEGTLSSGSLVLFLAYLGKLYAPIRGLSKLPDTFSKPSIAFERIQEVMDLEFQPTQEFRFRVPLFQGLIEFDRVSFGYIPDRPILKDVSFTIHPGQTAAFVGPTGAGKTTIISLLPRFYEPTAGTIRIDGWDVRMLSVKSVRKQLGFVLQETILFRGPVWQNIAYGRPTATRAEIIEAAKSANAHEFIEKMPDGYDSMVGERGATLSGGQRQRIGIARAIIRGAPILIMDEPTSGLDAASEAVVFDALQRLMAGRTCIIITHRLATIRHADVIFVLDDGRIVEHGTHTDLITENGLYARLNETQFRTSTQLPIK
jgi:subfamily B ATP-binding cassette protein MsbA